MRVVPDCMPGPRIVAHTLSYLPWRRIGAELATHALLTTLAADGWRAIVVPHRAGAEVVCHTIDGVHVVASGLARPARPSLVLAHLPFVTQAAEQARHAGVPLVLSVHGGPPGWTAARAAGISPALLLANSDVMTANLGRTGVPVIRLRPPVWPGADFGRREPLGDCVTLVNASAEKGAGMLAHLARALPDQRFLTVGGGYGEQVAIDLPNVEQLPHGTPMAEVWRRTRLLVMPSVEESWGMAAVEAMCRGIPVVGSTAVGLAECLGDLPTVQLDARADWIATVLYALDEGWQELHRAALRRAAELHPAPDLLSATRTLAALAGEGPTMSATRKYRNVRTNEEIDVDPESFMGRRVVAAPLVWHRVDVDAVSESTAVGRTSGPVTPVSGPEVAPTGGDAGGQPQLNAPQSDWAAYAVSCGAEPGAAAAATRNALIALYADRGR